MSTYAPCRSFEIRQSSLKKSSVSEREREKWRKVLIAELMSSEESNSEDEDTVIIKPL